MTSCAMKRGGLVRRACPIVLLLVLIDRTGAFRSIPNRNARLTQRRIDKSTTQTETTPDQITIRPETIEQNESRCAVPSHSRDVLRQAFLWAIPVLTSIAAFVFFKNTTHSFHALVEALSHHTWTPVTPEEVDLQTQVITQVVNGPVITSISVLFATLVSTTVSSLFSRQMEIRSVFIEQIDTLRLLQLLITNLPQTLSKELNFHLDQCSSSIIADEYAGERKSTAQSADPSIMALLSFLQHVMGNGSCGPLVTRTYDGVLHLDRLRSRRWKALQTSFPAMHYAALALMASTVCASFLIATDQSRQIFESLQVRLLWCILIAAFTSLAVVCYDLSSPFVGAYQIVRAADDELSSLHQP